MCGGCGSPPAASTGVVHASDGSGASRSSPAAATHARLDGHRRRCTRSTPPRAAPSAAPRYWCKRAASSPRSRLPPATPSPGGIEPPGLRQPRRPRSRLAAPAAALGAPDQCDAGQPLSRAAARGVDLDLDDRHSALRSTSTAASRRAGRWCARAARTPTRSAREQRLGGRRATARGAGCRRPRTSPGPEMPLREQLVEVGLRGDARRRPAAASAPRAQRRGHRASLALSTQRRRHLDRPAPATRACMRFVDEHRRRRRSRSTGRPGLDDHAQDLALISAARATLARGAALRLAAPALRSARRSAQRWLRCIRCRLFRRLRYWARPISP